MIRLKESRIVRAEEDSKRMGVELDDIRRRLAKVEADDCALKSGWGKSKKGRGVPSSGGEKAEGEKPCDGNGDENGEGRDGSG